MVELPQGIVVEERRGGAGILTTLVNDMIKLNSNGYIRTERTPTEAMPRVGQVVISSGEISAAMHESDAILEGVEALLEIETDCMELDCKLQLVEDVDVHRILDLHPNAKLNIETPEESKSSEWWKDISNHSNSWTRSSRLPTIEATIEAPEFVKAKAASMVHKHVHGSTLLKPGCVFSNENDGLFTLASNLKSHGKPLLVISRRIREELVVNFGLPADDCLWLSQKDGEGIQFVDLDAIKGTVYGFLEGNLRAVLLLDGLEYLANICGSKPVIDMVRELGDRMRFEDDCLLISFDKSAWTKSESAQLLRAAPHLDAETISAWNSDPDSLLDHPLMSPPTEEELLRLAAYLEANTPETFVEETVEEAEPEPVEPEIIEIEIVEEVPEIIEQVVEPVIEEKVPEVKKGPRSPQRVKRRTVKRQQILSEREMKLAGLAAAKNEREIGDLPPGKSIPKTPIGKARDVELPSIPDIIPTELSNAANQRINSKNLRLPETKLGPKTVERPSKAKPSSKNVISPLAARGVEIRRNVSKRSQASSVQQKEIDVDKELDSWKEELEEEN